MVISLSNVFIGIETAQGLQDNYLCSFYALPSGAANNAVPIAFVALRRGSLIGH